MHLRHGFAGRLPAGGAHAADLEQIPQNPQFTAGEPRLLRFFDQVRFYPVSEQELDEQREAFREGRMQVRIEERIRLRCLHRFLADNAEAIADFQHRQQQAFSAEVARWRSDDDEAEAQLLPPEEEDAIDGDLVSADLNGSVWKIPVEPGQAVAAGQPLIVVEAMKMELAVTAPRGIVKRISCRQGGRSGRATPCCGWKKRSERRGDDANHQRGAQGAA